MSKLEFIAECGKRLIDVAMALENERIIEALLNRDDDSVIFELDTCY